jgi:hypothetical protein
MARYIKLGDKAESFYDPYSEFGLVGKQVKLLEDNAAKSNTVTNALKGGHLTFATEAEFVAAGGEVPEEIPAFTSEFGDDAKEIIAYYKKTYEVTKEDVTAFKKLSLQEMVDELTKLAKE